MHINQITRNQQKGGHMESIYDAFDVRMLTSYIAQVENDHEYDKQAFKIVQLLNAVPHDCIRFPPSPQLISRIRLWGVTEVNR